MYKTSKHDELQFATQEIRELKRLYSFIKLQVNKSSSYKKQVLSALKSCKIFYFATYESIHKSNSSKNYLLLKNWETESLTIASLFKTNLRKQTSFFVYLSTCETDQIKFNDILDEALYLISAYQLANFRHVINILWKVNDMSWVNITTITYKWMQDHKISDDSISKRLHYASRYLRRR